MPSPGAALPPTPQRSPVNSGTTQEHDGNAAPWSVHGPREALVVTVQRADGTVTEQTVRPDWVRVGGSAECGGPVEAEVVLPAP